MQQRREACDLMRWFGFADNAAGVYCGRAQPMALRRRCRVALVSRAHCSYTYADNPDPSPVSSGLLSCLRYVSRKAIP